MRYSEYPQLNNRDWLLRRYTECQSISTIASEVGCGRQTVARALHRFGIATRAGGFPPKFPTLDDPKWLAKSIQEKTLVQLAEEVGCSRPTVRNALKRHGIPLPERRGSNEKRAESVRRTLAERGVRRGPQASNWKGGRITRGPYVFIYAPDHPRARAQGKQYVQEHILVAEQKLGRYLLPEERVHHDNYVKDDNRPENLIVKTRGKHIKDHFSEARKWRAYARDLQKILTDHNIPYPKELA